MSWQPIESVPLMREVLVFHPNWGANRGPRITVEFTGIHRDHSSDGYTHWMPLPAPPEAE